MDFFFQNCIVYKGSEPRAADAARYACERKISIKYKGSAWAPAFAGAHASGRAGQHFDHLRCSCPIWHALNFKVMPRVS